MAAKITVRLTGVAELKKALQAGGERALKLAGQGLYQEAEQIMLRSKEEFCPVDTGNLKSTGHVELPEYKGKSVTVELGYGGPAAEYALEVHENPRAGKTGGVSPQGRRYKHYSQVGQWKYLEQPINEAVPGMAGRLADFIKAGM